MNVTWRQGGTYKPLTGEAIQKIHETSLRVFEEVGIEVRLPEARRLFLGAGAKPGEREDVLTIPPEMVEKLVEKAPSMITLCGRDQEGELDCHIGGTNVYMGTGGTALNVQDPGSTEARPATLEDVAAMARLVDRLDNIDFYMLNVYPKDLDAGIVDVNRFYAALKYTRKHVMGGVYTLEGIRNTIAMAEELAGGADTLRERPFISMVTCVISPLRLDMHYSGLTIETARQEIPVAVPAEPLCGATGPVTLAGTLVVQNVDTLAGVMLVQLANPGAPVIYGSVASVADLHTMKYLSGAVEMGLLNAGAAQMAQYYKLPYYATAGMTDAKVSDAQAGYESAATNTMVALAGGNFIHDAAGFIEFCLTASYDKLVIDNEIIGMVMRAVRGIEVDEETLAYDVIQAVGPGGHFVTHPHTRKKMRSERYIPELADIGDRQEWVAAGAKDIREKAAEKVRSLLEESPSLYISGDQEERLMRLIPGLKKP